MAKYLRKTLPIIRAITSLQTFGSGRITCIARSFGKKESPAFKHRENIKEEMPTTLETLIEMVID